MNSAREPPVYSLEELAFVPLNALPQQAFSGIPIEASGAIAVRASTGRSPAPLLVLFLSREQVVCNCRLAPRRRLTNVSAIVCDHL
jgi:hypothetical protein